MPHQFFVVEKLLGLAHGAVSVSLVVRPAGSLSALFVASIGFVTTIGIVVGERVIIRKVSALIYRSILLSLLEYFSFESTVWY